MSNDFKPILVHKNLAELTKDMSPIGAALFACFAPPQLIDDNTPIPDDVDKFLDSEAEFQSRSDFQDDQRDDRSDLEEARDAYHLSGPA